MSLWYPRSTLCTIHARAAKIFSGHMTACCRCHIISNMACAEFLLKSGANDELEKHFIFSVAKSVLGEEKNGLCWYQNDDFEGRNGAVFGWWTQSKYLYESGNERIDF